LILALIVVAVALAILLGFIYSLFWFVLVGSRKQQPRANVLTSIGFGSVLAAIALWCVDQRSFGSNLFEYRALILFTGVCLCIVAMVVARFGGWRTSLPIVAAAFVVAINTIGTMFMQ
jgi:hypothetical protein